MAYTIDNLPAWSAHPRKGKEYLYAFFRRPWDKKQTSIELGVKTDQEARALAPAVILRYLNANMPSVIVQDERYLATFKQYRDEFFKDEYIGLKANTVDAAAYVVDNFLASVKSPLIADMTWPIFRDIIDSKKAEGRAVKGLYNYLVNVRKFFRYLVKHKVMAENIADQYPLPSTAAFYTNEVIWEKEEFTTFYKACTRADQAYLFVIYHTGMDLCDWYGLRRKHIVETNSQFVIVKQRKKATSPNQIIKFPLAHCPAKDVIMDAYILTKEPDDRLFALDYEDTEAAYDQYQWTTRTRRNRVWMKTFPGRPFKTIKQLRHTFVTECVSGKRFGKPIPQHALEKWMGWTPGSKVGAKVYTHIEASETAYLMQQA